MSAAAADRQAVDAIVELVKNQGLFDQFRRDCLTDVESNPTYQNLKGKVESHAERHLKHKGQKFGLTKNQLREEFRKEVTKSSDLFRIPILKLVDNLISSEIREQIQRAVEEKAREHLGIPSDSIQPETVDFPSTHGGLLRPNGKKSLWSSHSSTPVQDEIPDGRETAVTPNPTQLSPVDTSIDMDIDDNNSDAGGPSIDGHIEYLASGEEEPTGLDGIKEGSEVEESEGEKLEEIETSTVAEYVAVDDDHVEVEETQYIDGADLIRLPSQAGCFILEPICSDMSETEDEVTSAAELYLKENNKTSGQAESQSSDSC